MPIPTTHVSSEERLGESFLHGTTAAVENLMLNEYGIGVDCHSKFYQIVVLVNKDNVHRHDYTIPAEFAAITQAKDTITNLLGTYGILVNELRYTCESTGPYHMPLLLAWGGSPSVVNPLLAGPTRRKTDVLDAYLPARQAITNMWPESYIAPHNIRILRNLEALRRYYTRRRTRLTNRILNIATQYGHCITALGSTRKGPARLALENLAAGLPEKHPALNPAGFPDAIKPLITTIYAEVDTATNGIKAATTNVRAYLANTTFAVTQGDSSTAIGGKALIALLCTVPGIGEITAWTWLAHVGDPGRFQTKRQVAAFCGMDPSLKVSAGKVTSHSRRKGNAILHRALIQAAMTLLNHASEPFGQWGKRIATKHKKGGYRKAVGAVGRRLAEACWHVHRTLSEFTYKKFAIARPLPVTELPLSECALSPRTLRLLSALSITTTRQLSAAYATTLASEAGIGPKTLEEVDLCLKHHQTQRNSPHAPGKKPTVFDWPESSPAALDEHSMNAHDTVTTSKPHEAAS